MLFIHTLSFPYLVGAFVRGVGVCVGSVRKPCVHAFMLLDPPFFLIVPTCLDFLLFRCSCSHLICSFVAVVGCGWVSWLGSWLGVGVGCGCGTYDVVVGFRRRWDENMTDGSRATGT